MSTRISVTEQVNRVIVEEDVVRVISAGGVGPPGPQGPAGTLPTTTLGDMIVHGAAGAERLPVGSDGQALTVAAGMPAWGAVAGGGGSGPPSIPNWVVGRYYDYRSVIVFTQALSTKAPATTHVYVSPLFIPRRIRFDRVAIHLPSAPSSTATARLGLYTCDTAAYRPGTLVADFGEVGAGTTGVKELAINQWLDPGWHFAAVQANGNVVIDAMIGTPVQRVYGGVSGIGNSSVSYGAFAFPNTYGTFPATVAAGDLIALEDFIIISVRPIELT